jgi:PAT family beta-lactamase induction signal transducer AmpG
MRRQGASAGDISAFIGAIYLPWAFKWLAGPVVDVVASDRFGRRRAWIIAMQLGMVGSLFMIQAAGLAAGVATLTTLIIVHNVFAATQDVAIDALAVGVLKEDERGLAGGLTFAAAYLGQAVGGSGALAIGSAVGFDAAFLFCAASILLVTIFVVLPLQEPKSAPSASAGTTRAQRIAAEIRQFVREAVGAFTANRASLLGLFFAVLPVGAMALGLAMLTNLAVDLGMDDNAVSALNLWTTVIAAAGCIAGGWLSDRLGRRRALTWFIISTALPTLWLAWRLREAGFVMPLNATQRASQVLAPGLLTGFWIAANIYWFTNGLMYGARAALFMDVSNPRVAATQFTAYMALSNLGISYSAKWQGWTVDRYGYPLTLAVDAAVGLVCLVALASMGRITAHRHLEAQAQAVPMPRPE